MTVYNKLNSYYIMKSLLLMTPITMAFNVMVHTTNGNEIVNNVVDNDDSRHFLLRQGGRRSSSIAATRKMQEEEAIASCILITTGTNSGYLNVLVNTNDGNGFVEVTTPDTLYQQSEVILDECYTNLVGVQVTSSRTNGWSGSVEYSLNDKSSPYLPMICLDCTGPVETTELIVVDGDGSSSGDTECLNGSSGNVCTLTTTLPQLEILVDNVVEGSPLGRCQADCDIDDDCEVCICIILYDMTCNLHRTLLYMC